jgi:hypothetical protein
MLVIGEVSLVYAEGKTVKVDETLIWAVLLTLVYQPTPSLNNLIIYKEKVIAKL